MKFDIVERSDELQLDKSLNKNKWKWDWLEREVKLGDGETVLLRKHVRKLKQHGKAYSAVCNADISYGG